MIRRLTLLLLLCELSATPGCGSRQTPEKTKSPPPAKVAQPAHEKDLATVTLTPQAEQRLGIRTVEVQRKPVPRKRTFGGEVVCPPGQTITVSAPVSGTLATPDKSQSPLPGTSVAKGQPIFSLLPLLSPERSVLTPSERVAMAESRAALATSQIEAEKGVQSAKVRVEAAEIALGRSKLLLQDKAGSQQAVDDAEAKLNLAQKDLEAAQARYELLAKTTLEADEGRLEPRTIAAPVSGILSNVAAVAGETVVAGDILFELFQYDRAWIRVPVYVGLWRDVRTDQEALVTEFGQSSDVPGRLVSPVVAPPSADPGAATVDLFYQVANENRELRPGHKVAVTVNLRGEETSLVVPWASILHDVHGGTWVYEQVAPHTFVRRRVHVRFVVASEAVLAVGPEPGTRVVTDGAAELFGTEFGFGK